MRCPVAAVFLFVFLLSTTVPGQRRGVSTQRQGPSRPETAKICQGLSIPDGYVIVGYVTSSVCPHGAYVIKRQNRELEISDASTPDTGQPNSRNARKPDSGAVAVSRPRRVNVETENREVALHGSGAASYSGPPTLTGSASNGTPVNATNTAPTSAPEEVAEGDVVRIDTTLVTVPVSVLDRQGRFVTNLQKEDFSVFENGNEQPIAYFEPTEKPFTVALLLDTSASTHFHLSEIKEAAVAFAKQLRPQDAVLVVTFNDQVLLLTEVTNNIDVISAVIDKNAYSGNSTRLYDAVDLVIKERLNKIRGRKAIVLFTDGVDTSSYLSSYESTLREAEELDALIYPIQYDTSDYMRAMQGGGNITITTTTSNWPFPGRTTSRVIQGVPSIGSPPPGSTTLDYEQADQYLRALANKSGGRLYSANDPAQLAQSFSAIAEELRRQYSLGYYPQTPVVQNGERRLIKVRVRQPNLAVRARDSYMQASTSRTQ
jgi:Ca-activated chloride channel homolog